MLGDAGRFFVSFGEGLQLLHQGAAHVDGEDLLHGEGEVAFALHTVHSHHLCHTAALLADGEERRGVLFAQGDEGYLGVFLAHGGLKEGLQGCGVRLPFSLDGVQVGVDAAELHLVVFALTELGIVGVHDGIEHQNGDVLCGVQIQVVALGLGIGGIVNGAFFLVLQILGQGAPAAGCLLEQDHALGTVVKLAVLDTAILDVGLEAFPILFELLAVVVKEEVETVGDLLDDVGGYLADVGVVLQVAAGDVQGKLGAIQNALQVDQELGADFFDVVRHEHGVVEKTDLTLLGVEGVLAAGEVQDALEVQGVIGVDVHPEQRVGVIVELLAVELLVLLVAAIGGVLLPKRGSLVDQLLLFAVVEVDLHGHEGAVFFQDGLQGIGGKVGFLVLHEVHGDLGAPFGTGAGLHFVGACLGAFPQHGGSVGVGLGLHGDLIRHHEHGIEAQAEVADDAASSLSLVFGDEVHSPGQGDVVDVFLYLGFRHTDAVVGDGDGAGFLVYPYVDAVGSLAFRRLTQGDQPFMLGDRIAGIGQHLTEVDVLLGIQPFFDDGKKMLGIHRQCTVCHMIHTPLFDLILAVYPRVVKELRGICDKNVKISTPI